MKLVTAKNILSPLWIELDPFTETAMHLLLSQTKTSSMHLAVHLIWVFFVCVLIPIPGLSEELSNAGSEDAKNAESEIEAGHSLHGEAFNEGPRQAAYLMQGMGNVHWEITTKSPMAQRFFDQAIGQIHGFWYFEAERSFRQVAAFDPDCAMAYWGMARANTKNESRARGFIVQAVQHLDKTSPTERRLIEALKIQLEEKMDGKPVLKKKRLETYVKTLEEIGLDNPDNIELKAMLALQMWENEKEGLPLQSRTALEAILNEVFSQNPRHPAHHFVIHLWDNARRERALKSAAACGPAAPGIAHMWHMPGHIYSGLHRYEDAAWQQEASARVDHAHMIRDRVMPDQIHNFAHNNEWLIRTWTKTGQVEKAIALAKNMCQLPRHPKYNTLDKGSAMFGRSRLLSVLTTYGLWEPLLSLTETAYLEPIENSARQDEQLAWSCVAQWMCAKPEAETSQLELAKKLSDVNLEYAKLTSELRAIDANKPATNPKTKAPVRPTNTIGKQRVRAPQLDVPIELDKDDWNELAIQSKSPEIPEQVWDETVTKNWTKPQQAQAKEHKKLKTRLDKLKTYVALAKAYHAAAEQRYGDAIAFARQADTLVPVFERIVWYGNAGYMKTAMSKCRERIKASQGEVLPLAVGVWIAWQAKDRKSTETWINDLSKIVHTADATLPQLQRLKPIIDEFQLSSRFASLPKSPSDIGDRPNLDLLGPAQWSPYQAPTWELPDSKGVIFSSKQLHGKPTVLIFYLGLGCLHCVEQLQVFSPMVEQFQKAGMDIIAVSSEKQTSLRTALANFDKTMSIPLLPNPDLDLFKSMRCFDDFENQPLHGTFLIDRFGRVVWQDIGPDPFMDAKFLLAEGIRLNALSDLDVASPKTSYTKALPIGEGD